MPAQSPLPIRAVGPNVAPPLRIARGGFTLIELLVVIGIIAVLAGLVVVAIMSFAGEGRDEMTRTRMEILNNFMAAYATSEASRSGGQGNVEAAKLPSVVQVAAGAGDYYSTFDGFSDSNAANVTDSARAREPLVAPGRLTEDSMVSEPAVARTQAVLRRLLTVPANQTAFAGLAEDAKSRLAPTGGSILAHVDPSAGSSPLDPPLLMDGHNNPILFVPPQGLTEVRFRDGTYADPSAAPGATWRVLAGDEGSAFWVSAGPDGDFRTGDDNVYSTAVVVRPRPTVQIP